MVDNTTGCGGWMRRRRQRLVLSKRKSSDGLVVLSRCHLRTSRVHASPSIVRRAWTPRKIALIFITFWMPTRVVEHAAAISRCNDEEITTAPHCSSLSKEVTHEANGGVDPTPRARVHGQRPGWVRQLGDRVQQCHYGARRVDHFARSQANLSTVGSAYGLMILWSIRCIHLCNSPYSDSCGGLPTENDTSEGTGTR